MVFGDMSNIGVAFIRATELGRKILLQVAQVNSVLGSGRTGNTGYHCGQIEFDDFGIFGFEGISVEKTQCFGIGFDDVSLIGPVGHLEVIDGFLVDGKKTQGGAVFRSHVGQCGPVGDS